MLLEIASPESDLYYLASQVIIWTRCFCSLYVECELWYFTIVPVYWLFILVMKYTNLGLNWSWMMFYRSTSVVNWHNRFPLLPIQTEFLTSVLSSPSLNVILSVNFFLSHWRYSLRCSYRDIHHILAVKHNSPYQFIDIEGLCCVLFVPVHRAPCDGGQVFRNLRRQRRPYV